MRDKDDWSEANRNRDYWGTKDYSPDMDFSHCKQSEPTDEYGTVEEIFNAMCYYDVMLESIHCRFPMIQDSIQLMVQIQKGITDEEFEKSGVTHKMDDQHGMRKSADPQEIANAVHHQLDWLRATNKRKWDTRGLNPSRQMLNSCVKGMYLTSATLLHYDERAER